MIDGLYLKNQIKMSQKNIRLGKVASLAFLLLLLLSACGDQEPVYVPGTYVNEAEGYYSTLKISVTVNAYDIVSIDILSHEEPEILADVVFEELPPRIMKENSVQVEGVSGATYTSKALLEAVGVALERAKVVEE